MSSSDITDINSTFIHYAFNTCYNIGLNYYRRKYKLLYISRHTTNLMENLFGTLSNK